MMKEVLSGTFESGKVKFVKTNVKPGLLRRLQKRLIERSASSEWGADPTKKIKKDLVD